jgi:hypothetical protein
MANISRILKINEITWISKGKFEKSIPQLKVNIAFLRYKVIVPSLDT